MIKDNAELTQKLRNIQGTRGLNLKSKLEKAVVTGNT